MAINVLFKQLFGEKNYERDTMAWDKAKQEEYANSLAQAKLNIDLAAQAANTSTGTLGSLVGMAAGGSASSTTYISGPPAGGPIYVGTPVTSTSHPSFASITWSHDNWDTTQSVPMKKFEELQAHVIDLVKIIESLMNEVDDLKIQIAKRKVA